MRALWALCRFKLIVDAEPDEIMGIGESGLWDREDSVLGHGGDQSGARMPQTLAARSTPEAAFSSGRNQESLQLSVVMPCLNERLTLGVCVEKAHLAMKRLGLRGEIIVADNGSSDGSQAIAV